MPSAFVDVQTAIIDSECVAWDPEKKQILPFQVLTTRKKKDVDAKGRAFRTTQNKVHGPLSARFAVPHGPTLLSVDPGL